MPDGWLAIIRWICFPAGLVVLAMTWRSVITAIILPRSVRSKMVFYTYRVTRAVFSALVRLRSTYREKDKVLALFGPILLLAILVNWLVWFLVGYTLVFWPIVRGGLWNAVLYSGSALFTLGSTPLTPRYAALDYIAAATGMIVIALQIGYLTTIYGNYNRRELQVTALRTRSGAPAWGPRVLVRHVELGAVSTLPAFYASWETWSADVVELHSCYPWLMGFRSPEMHSSWITSLLATLDSAALYVALAPDNCPAEARLFLRAGATTFRVLARIAVRGYEMRAESPQDDNPPIMLPRFEFDQAVAMLESAGFGITRTGDSAWLVFCRERSIYEAAAYGLAETHNAPSAPWSGKRAFVDEWEEMA